MAVGCWLRQVVACFPLCGVECRVPLRLFYMVLLLQAGNHRLHIDDGLLRLYAGDRPDVLLADGQQWLLRVLLVSGTPPPRNAMIGINSL